MSVIYPFERSKRKARYWSAPRKRWNSLYWNSPYGK